MLFRGKGAIMLDLTGRIEFASSHFCELTGQSLDEMFGKSFFDFVFPEDLNKAKSILEMIKNPPSPTFRFRLRRMDGEEVWVDILGGPLRTAGGEIYGITATVTQVETMLDAQTTASKTGQNPKKDDRGTKLRTADADNFRMPVPIFI